MPILPGPHTMMKLPMFTPFQASIPYTVTLTDAHGCTFTNTRLLTVTGTVAAFFMSDSTAICAPLTVTFADSSTGATSYSWSFGDGSSSTITSPTDVYDTSGLYTVRLVTSNSHGCTDTATGHVRIFGYANDFTYDTAGCAPLAVSFSFNPTFFAT